MSEVGTILCHLRGKGIIMIHRITSMESPKKAYSELVNLYLNSDAFTQKTIREKWDFGEGMGIP